MNWIGAGIGAILGAQRGRLLGGVVGAVIGNWAEGKIREMKGGAKETMPQPQADDPYEVLGCQRGATDDEVKGAYREKVKQLHPDTLRAQGLSEELIALANGQMARINAAWSEIRRERGL